MSVGLPERSGDTLERVPTPGLARASWSASERMNQIDALRVLSCLSVIAVHAIGAPYPIDSVGLGQASLVLHYSREIFFFVSALVLVRTYFPRLGPDGRLPDESAFRRRRFRLVGVPYLWWTTIYFAVSIYHTRATEPFGPLLKDLPLRWLYLVVTGNGSYHMYFLLVTLQFAAVFPGFLWLLRRTAGRHGWLLLGSGVLQVATLAAYHWWLLPDDGWRGLLGDASLLCYQFWLVLGGVAALHLDLWHSWLMRWRALVIMLMPVMAGGLLWSYWAQLPSRGALGASSPLQPLMVVWSLYALAVLYLAAVWLMQRGAPAVRAAFSYGAQLSFGVYLAHPLILDLLLSLGRRLNLVPPAPTTSIALFLLTVLGTVALCAVLHRTRFSVQLMGRNRRRPGDAPKLSGRATRAVALSVAVLAAIVPAMLVMGSGKREIVVTDVPPPPAALETLPPPLPRV